MGGSVTRSIRAQPELWERAEVEARRRGLKVNAWVGMVITDALGGEVEEATTRSAEGKPAAPAAKVATVVEAVRSAEVRQVAEAGVQIGPQRPAPGSRLKRQGR